MMNQSINHILWSCPVAQDVWGYGPIIFQKRSTSRESFMQLFDTLLG
jgi:hypothetical protein